jgi:peroxiredoxin Q/BCP
MMRTCIAAVAAVVAGVGLAAFVPVLHLAADESPGPSVGSPAPDFQAPSSTGGNISLADLKGRIVVLYFYPKDDTPGCTVQAKQFRDADDDLRELGVAILGVSLDGLKSHARFIKKYNLNFPLLSDDGGKIHDAYGAFKKGSLFGRTAMGVDRSTFVIDKDGIIRKVWRSVSVKGHSDEVLAFIRKELLAKAP